MQNIQNIKRIKNYEGTMTCNTEAQVPLLHYKNWEQIAFVRHAFSTRFGGVSEGIYRTMNFKEDGDDTNANIRENYRRIAEAMGCDLHKMVRSQLCHGVRVHEVSAADFGEGVLAKSRLLDYDGLITNIPGVTLVATFADCVPLYFIDMQHHTIGLAHSGWRGTAGRIARTMVDAMAQRYGTRPQHLRVAVGPCICGDCYEVGAEFVEAFSGSFSGDVEKRTQIAFSDILRPAAAEDKYFLDLRLANLMTFLDAGIPREQIEIADICTCCNPEWIFSHRYTKGKRGVSAAFLGLTD